jgi:Holliday junction resolvasome RuvABC endonuclease subunit
MIVLMGLDLSAGSPAACAVPSDWDGDWRRVGMWTIKEPLPKDATDEQRARRCERIATGILRLANNYGAHEAWIEGYAFSMRTSAHTLGEVGGVVRLELVRSDISIHTANMGTARKLLLGKAPRKGAKVAAANALRAAGSPAWTLDESDAFVCVNLGLSEHAGAFCFCQAAP